MSRPPKSTDHHKLHGTFRADRHASMPLNPVAKVPKAPAWLSKAAKTKWRETATKLCAAGVLCDLDLDALAAYCVAFTTWQAAAQKVESEGTDYTTETGVKKAHPAVAIMQAADRSLKDWAGKLGLHPDARKKLRIEVPEDDIGVVPSRRRQPDELEELLRDRDPPLATVG